MARGLRSWCVPLLALSGLLVGVVLRAADDDDRAPPPLELGESVAVPRDQVCDLTLTIAPELPCVWPAGMTPSSEVIVPHQRSSALTCMAGGMYALETAPSVAAHRALWWAQRSVAETKRC